MSTRRAWIEREGEVAVIRPCALTGVARSGVYRASTDERVSALDPLLLALIDAEYTRYPFDGSRCLVVFLKTQGQMVNRKRVQRRMGILGLAGMAPGPATSKPHPEHQVYPSLSARGRGHAPEPGVEYRYHVRALGAWLCRPGGHRRYPITETAIDVF